MNAKVWFLETRPHFLLLVPVSVLTGVSAAYYDTGEWHPLRLLLAFLGALLAHASVNVLNDYFDFKSGIDLRTRRTPFSGGSGVLPAGTLRPQHVRLFGICCLLALIPIGIYFVSLFGWALLPLGLTGMVLVYSYTSHITKVPWLCLLAPGLGFGPVMVVGTYFAQAGSYSWTAVLASVVPGFLVSNLLLLNEFPDVEADKVARRKHLPIAIGTRNSALVYSLLILACYVALLAFAALGALPWPALLGLLTLPLALPTIKGVLRHHDNVERLIPYMGRNVQLTLGTPALMSVGILLNEFIAR